MDNDFKKLIDWSQQFHTLPWRNKRNLYTTLVSEIMLQQTTVPTVLNKFDDFIAKYPSLQTLAQISEDEMLIAWKGLGYYRRAKNLLNAAKYIQDTYNGDIPTNYYDLIQIPGIGDYTANALLAIGCNRKSLAIDTNLERVLARYYGLDTEYGVKLKKHLQELFENNKILTNIISYRDLNEALMDLGREFCKANTTNCGQCPLQAGCKSLNNPLYRPIRPIKSVKKQLKYKLELLRVIIFDQKQIWCYQKQSDEWLSGQWECPSFILNTDDNKLRQYPKINRSKNKLKNYLNEYINDYRDLKQYKTAITKYAICNHIIVMSLEQFYQYFDWHRELKAFAITKNSNLSTATQKALKHSGVTFNFLVKSDDKILA